MTDKNLPILSVSEVCQRLNASGLPWVVFAGAAAHLYGAKRQITDIDILVSSLHGSQMVGLFPEGQPKYREDGSLAGLQLVGIDIIAGLKGIYTLEVDEALKARITEHEIADITMPVIPVEDNILIKAAWRRGSEEDKHDWEDVKAMMAHSQQLDWDYINMRAQAAMSASQAGETLKNLRSMWRKEG